MLDIEPLRNDIRYRRQGRKASAQSLMTKDDIAAADFETIDGDAWLFTLAHFDEGEVKSSWVEFDESFPFTLHNFMKWIGNEIGRIWRRGGGVKGLTIPYLYYWNLTYDASSIIKSLQSEAIDELLSSNDVVVDAITHERVEVERKGFNYLLTDEQKEMELVSIHWLPRKYLRLKPLGAFSEYTDPKGNRRRLGAIQMFDMAQFYGASLKAASRSAVEEGLIESTKLDTIDASRINDAKYREDNRDEIIKYGLVDSEVTLKLSWLKVKAFESEGVRMIMPYSLASIAERNLLDNSDIPTLDDMMKKNREIVMMGWSSYRGGWFETTGTGFIGGAGVRAFDLASAYPYIMYHLRDYSKGYWSRGTAEDSNLFTDWMKDREPYSLGFAECIVIFPEGMRLYPAVMMSSKGCTMTPQRVGGWFCADELAEFEKWGAKITYGRWCSHHHSPTSGYPLRDFITRWYSIKHEEGMKKGTDEFKQPAYDVSKICINSTYGKLIATVESDDGWLKSGKLWNPIWGAVVTGATRARMAEFIRLNPSVYTVATDGIVVDNGEVEIPERPLPACFNLGEWEEETPEGGADLLAVMSGVYSLIPKVGKSKTMVRGNASLFVGRHHPDCLKKDRRCQELDCQPLDWLEFCKENADRVMITRDEENHPHSRPYSLGEARVRGDYSLVNQFRVVKATIRVIGDSNKRIWKDGTPQTFSDLMTNWYESSPHRTLP